MGGLTRHFPPGESPPGSHCDSDLVKDEKKKNYIEVFVRTAGLICPPDIPALTQTPKPKATRKTQRKKKPQGVEDSPIPHPRFIDKNDYKMFFFRKKQVKRVMD